MMQNLPLRLQRLSAGRGIGWVSLGWQAFRRQPLGLMSLFSSFLVLALLLSVVPLLGELVSVAALPLLSLAYMVAVSQMVRASKGGPATHPMLALRELRTGDAARWRSLVALCALYAVGMLLLVSWSAQVDQGSFAKLIQALAPPRTEASRAEIERLLASDALTQGLWIRFGGVALLSIPFWHAPGLIWWGGQGVWQALFSSTLGVWRTKGAFVMYLLTLLAAMLAISMVIGAISLALGGSMLLGVLVTVGGVVSVVLFYATLWFSFDETFGVSAEPVVPD